MLFSKAMGDNVLLSLPSPSSRIIVGSQVYDMKFVPQHLSTRKLLVLHLRGNYFGKEHITGTLARFEILNRMRTIPPSKKEKNRWER